jgi:hypothetical protein
VSNNGAWLLVNVPLVGQAASDNFGSSVSLSANGDTLAVGANNVAAGEGAVYIYTAPAGTGTWTLHRSIAGSDVGALSNANFGQSVALSASGDRLVASMAGRSTANTGGALLVYERNATNAWNLETTLTRPIATNDILGYTVAVNAAGDRIAACEATPILSGQVVIFVREAGGVWSLVQTLDATDSSPFIVRLFGVGLALSDSGDTLAITAASELSRGAWWSVGICCACCSCFGFAFHRCNSC